jgi:hypothetical protein
VLQWKAFAGEWRVVVLSAGIEFYDLAFTMFSGGVTASPIASVDDRCLGGKKL